MVPTKLRRSWLLTSLLGLITLGLSSAAQSVDQPHRFGLIPLSQEAYQSYLKTTPSGELQTLQAILPPAYNAADLGFVTPAKDQGNCGSCWAFASVGAMESKLLIKGVAPAGFPPDVSEQQQVSCNTEQLGCQGGYETAPLFWAPPPNPNNGPLPESVFPYTASDAACHNPSGSQMNYRVIDFYTVPITAIEFKASLYEDGPGMLGYVIKEDFLTFWDSAPPQSVYNWDRVSAVLGAHMVLFIGWDDTKRAFLLKNSWGANGGPNGDGTFWMSYEDMDGFGLTNFSITAETPSRPVPTTSDGGLALAVLSLFLIGLKSVVRVCPRSEGTPE